MKKILMCVVAAALTGMTGRAAPAAKEAVPADPNAFHSYTKGMEATKENPSLALWQKDEAAAVAALTAPEALKAFVADEAAACGLLASVKPAYATDPLAAVQIAAVTQFVMRQKNSAPRLGSPVSAKMRQGTPDSSGRISR